MAVLFYNLRKFKSIFFHFFTFLFIYHKIQTRIKQNSYTKTNESGEEAQKTMRLIDIGVPQSKK